MADVTLQNITKRFKAVTALKDVSFEVKDGEFFVLLGPTGAGKTTTLRVIAGLESQYEGSELINGEPVERHVLKNGDLITVGKSTFKFVEGKS